MATRIYKINPHESLGQVTEDVGSAVASDAVELTVDLADTIVNTHASTRALTKEEVLASIDKIKAHIVTSQWPPA